MVTDSSNRKKIALFDVDGTLTPARLGIEAPMVNTLKSLRSLPNVSIGVVGGSDLLKQKEQLGPETLSMYDYNFAENGVVAYKEGKLINETSIATFLGEEKLKKLINFCLHYIADLEIPLKRGTFIEFRTGMINVSPVGRSCSREERNDFEKFCLKNDIRKNFVKALKQKFETGPDAFGLSYSIGGQISFDVFPQGWDKTFCLQFLEAEKFDEIHFFGDKTFEGGNDFEIFSHEKVIGHTVKAPEDTMKQLLEIFGDLDMKNVNEEDAVKK